MRKIFFASFLILSFCCFLSAQSNENLPCPEIKIVGPDNTVNSGEDIIFTLNVGNSDKITYNWAVNNGTIIEGQGTPVIKVDTTGLADVAISATVEVKGLPQNCESVAAATAIVTPVCRLPRTLDQYEKLPFAEEKLRIANVAIELENVSDSMAVFMIYYTEKDNLQDLKSRLLNIAKLLTEKHGIAENRFSFILTQQDGYSTTIYHSPVGIVENPDWEKDLNKLISEIPAPNKTSSRKKQKQK